MEHTGINKLGEKQRSSGDGMDNSLLSLSEAFLHDAHVKLKCKISPAVLKSLRPVVPKNPVKLIPKYMPKQTNKPIYLTRKPKDPKFVPYEPYKGAVEPIIPYKKVISKKQKHSKNNVDIQDLVIQMSELRTAELSQMKLARDSDEPVITKKKWEEEKNAYETDIKNLRETNAHLENQLKFQAQVNGELKTLLVAAVGEDLESRVKHLTEDKLQLARALLKSANHITSHQEQTEWLSGQCEVWRSKFLASSLMVEELARWKSALTNRINELQNSVKSILDERNKVRTYLLQTHSYTTEVLKKLNGSENIVPLKSVDLIELSMMNCDLSKGIYNKLFEGSNGDTKALQEDMLNLPKNTPAESHALQILKMPVCLLNKPDAICNALMGAAISISGGQMFLQHPSSHATCCAHCKGEIQEDVVVEIEPQVVQRGESATLRCNYDLEGKPLYAVKWYRGHVEFYRYTPNENPKTKLFPFRGLEVDLASSNEHQVFLRNVEFILSGNFTCEVSTEGPPFHTGIVSREMSVVVLPDSPPILKTDKSLYDIGDTLSANCTSAPSRPAASLSFVLNNIVVCGKCETRVPVSDELYMSYAALQIQLTQSHFNTERVILRCVAQVTDMYQRDSELRLDKMTEPVPEKVMSVNQSLQHRFSTFVLVFGALVLSVV